MSAGAIAVVCLSVLVCAASILMPWVGFVGYSTCAILAPQWVWRASLENAELQKFLSAFTVLGFLLTGLRSQKIPPGVKRAMLCYSLYTALVVLGGQLQVNPVNPTKTMMFVDITWKIWLMSMIGIMIIDKERKLAILMACIVAVAAWNAWELNVRYLKQGFLRVNEFYFAGLDNNLYSISTVPLLTITLAYFFVTKLPWRQALAAFVLALQIHQIMFLESRGTMLGILLTGTVAVYFMPKNPRTITAVVMVAIVGAVLAGPPVIREFSSIFAGNEELDESAASRYQIWKAGAGIIMDYPIMGVGPWAGEAYTPKYIPGYSGRRNYKALHNLFFEIGTGMGIPGLIVYISFFAIPWYLHYRLWKTRREQMSEVLQVANLATLAGIPGYWLASLFSSGALVESSYILVVAACAALAIAESSQLTARTDAEEEQQDGVVGEEGIDAPMDTARDPRESLVGVS